MYLAQETVFLTLKAIIYNDNDYPGQTTLGAVPLAFLILHGLRVIFPVTLTLKFLQ